MEGNKDKGQRFCAGRVRDKDGISKNVRVRRGKGMVDLHNIANRSTPLVPQLRCCRQFLSTPRVWGKIGLLGDVGWGLGSVVSGLTQLYGYFAGAITLSPTASR
jgi:hypothetical protein